RGRGVSHLLNLDLSLVVRLHDGIHQLRSCDAIRNRTDGKRLLVHFHYLRTYLDLASSLTIVVIRHIYHSSCLEVGIDIKLLSAQIFYRCLDEFIEIVWKDLS